MDWKTLLGVAVRHGLTIGGTWFVSKGYLDAGMVEEIAGAGMVLFAAGWSVAQKMRAAN